MKTYTSLLQALLLSLFLIVPFSAFSQETGNVEQIETVVDKLPKLKNARGGINKYIEKKISYPENAKLRGVEGDVWVGFVVSSSGVVKDVKVEKSVDPLLDQVVVDFVKKTGPWKPGELNGKIVNTQMIVPVKFTLTHNERNLANQLKSFNLLDSPPLFVLDDKLIDGMTEIEDYNVKSIRVIKGSKAIKLYGDQGKNGVVIITSKNGTPPLYY